MREDSEEVIISWIWDNHGKEVGYEKKGVLVRCKECKYWNDEGLCKKHSSPIVGAIYGTDADDYCSEGKRKEQE